MCINLYGKHILGFILKKSFNLIEMLHAAVPKILLTSICAAQTKRLGPIEVLQVISQAFVRVATILA